METRYKVISCICVEVGSMIGALSVPIMMFVWKAQHVPVAYQGLATLAALAIVVKHHSNVKRLINGTESKIGQKVEIKEEKEQ